MADAHFWFDQRIANSNHPDTRGDHRYPPRIIRMLESGDTTWPSLRKMYAEVPNLKHVEFDRQYALFMRGTTGELTGALKKDIAGGVGHLAVLRENAIDLRYVRQKPGRTKTVTIIGIGAPSYWGDVPVGRLPEAANRMTWVQLASYVAPDGLTLRKGTERLEFAAVDLTRLVDLVERCQGVEPWY